MRIKTNHALSSEDRIDQESRARLLHICHCKKCDPNRTGMAEYTMYHAPCTHTHTEREPHGLILCIGSNFAPKKYKLHYQTCVVPVVQRIPLVGFTDTSYNNGTNACVFQGRGCLFPGTPGAKIEAANKDISFRHDVQKCRIVVLHDNLSKRAHAARAHVCVIGVVCDGREVTKECPQKAMHTKGNWL